MLASIDHVGIACSDIDRSIHRYQMLFGLQVTKYEDRPVSGVLEAMLRVAPSGSELTALSGASYVQLLQPTRSDTALAQFLRERGEGVQHIGYGVVDLQAALRQLRRHGVNLVPDMPQHGIFGNSIAFLEASSIGGVLTELVQLDGR